MKKTFSLYAVIQTLIVFFSGGRIGLSTPCWILWYLLSCSIWAGTGWLWYRFCKEKGKVPILIGAIAIGCAAGFVSSIGREYSLSRTLVFFPYFWMGLICDRKFPWEKLRPAGFPALVTAMILMLGGGNRIPVDFLYQAASYDSLKNGFSLRLFCYLIGMLLCLFFLSFTPAKRFPFTKAGADTMPVYLIHAPVVLCLWKLDIQWTLYPLITALILYTVYKIQQWYCSLYGIVPSERRDNRWLLFKRSMKNMRSRSTDSCCH